MLDVFDDFESGFDSMNDTFEAGLTIMSVFGIIIFCVVLFVIIFAIVKVFKRHSTITKGIADITKKSIDVANNKLENMLEEQEVYCEYCGAKLSAEDKKCSSCGARRGKK